MWGDFKLMSIDPNKDSSITTTDNSWVTWTTTAKQNYFKENPEEQDRAKLDERTEVVNALDTLDSDLYDNSTGFSDRLYQKLALMSKLPPDWESDYAEWKKKFEQSQKDLEDEFDRLVGLEPAESKSPSKTSEIVCGCGTDAVHGKDSYWKMHSKYCPVFLDGEKWGDFLGDEGGDE